MPTTPPCTPPAPPPDGPTTSPIVSSALLGLVEQAGLAVATLTEGLSEAELLRSRLTRTEVLRQLRTLANSAALLPPDVRALMPEADWPGWDHLRPTLHGSHAPALDEALWFASHSLVPALLLWLRVYQKSHPELFRMSA